MYVYLCMYCRSGASTASAWRTGRPSEPPKRVLSGWVVSWDPSFALQIKRHV